MAEYWGICPFFAHIFNANLRLMWFSSIQLWKPLSEMDQIKMRLHGKHQRLNKKRIKNKLNKKYYIIL